MSARRTNVGLLVALIAAFITGAAAFAIGSGWNVYVTVAHGIAGVLIVILSPWKSAIVGRGMRRRRSGRWPSVLLAVATIVTLVFGFLHSTGIGRSLGGITAMQLHVGAALVALPLALWHTIARPARTYRADLGRRRLLTAGVTAAGAALAYGAIEALSQVASLPGRDRRVTGSYERGSGDPDEMPVTQWLNDRVPAVDIQQWRLRTPAGEWAYDELSGFDDVADALLDCTGGWFATQTWHGVWLSDLIRDDGEARSIVVTSVTGYARTYPLADAPRLMLATRVNGAPLSAGHGFPARLVAPGRRGFWWVKWVDRIELSARPWWLQSPFPLT